jgi:hypothetical protein
MPCQPFRMSCRDVLRASVPTDAIIVEALLAAPSRPQLNRGTGGTPVEMLLTLLASNPLSPRPSALNSDTFSPCAPYNL